jgi:ferric-dicitrate binding protein FerR (iron transport regulator)
MKKEELINKWLNNELSNEELEAFKRLDEYSSYTKLSDHAKAFAAPEFNEELSLAELKNKTSKPKKNITIYNYIAAAAAIVIIAFIVFRSLGIDDPSVSHSTLVAEVTQITLSDNSAVSLNSNSSLTYNSKDWKSNRTLILDGEALFKVEKGEKFKVRTSYGDVQVLGTVFNVKSRDYTFQVTCFEGQVQVNLNGKKYILGQNDNLILKNDHLELNTSLRAIPAWQQNITIVKDKSLKYVIEELKNYYDLNFDFSKVDTTKRFTGSFDNLNINLALNSITLPLGLTYRIDGETVIFDYK